MKIAIIDDSIDDRSIIKSYIEEYFLKSEKNYLPQISEFSSGEAFLKVFQAEKFQIIVLDIFMEGISGMEVAYKIYAADKNACIIFLTTSDDFIYEGYAVRAVRYIKKPVFQHKKKLWSGLDFCQDKLKSDDCISVTINQKTTDILLNNIIYLECIRKKVYCHLNNNVTLIIQENIKKLSEEILQ